MNAYEPNAPSVNRRSNTRRGAAAVEFAIVLPVIVLLMLGSMEMGRAVMVRHVLEEAARAGCRIAVFENATKQDVLDIVATSMTAASINNYTVTVNPDPPQNLSAFEAVTVTVDYADVSWLSSASFMSGSSITGLCVMPAEGDGANDPDSNDTPTGKKNKKNKSKSKSKSKSSGKKNKK